MFLVCKNIVDKSIRETFVRSFRNFKSDNFKNGLQEIITYFMASILLYQEIMLINYLATFIPRKLQHFISMLLLKNFLEREQTCMKNNFGSLNVFSYPCKKAKAT